MQWLSQYIYDQESATTYQFPEPDLQAQLVDLYFGRFNVFTPILHRPTFEGELSAGTHLRNRAFAGVTLLVCALGALVSNDRRVNIPDDNDNWQSAGWFWFRQIQVMDRSFVGGEKLYGLQIAAVCFNEMVYDAMLIKHSWRRRSCPGVFHLSMRGCLPGLDYASLKTSARIKGGHTVRQ